MGTKFSVASPDTSVRHTPTSIWVDLYKPANDMWTATCLQERDCNLKAFRWKTLHCKLVSYIELTLGARITRIHLEKESQ